MEIVKHNKKIKVSETEQQIEKSIYVVATFEELEVALQQAVNFCTGSIDIQELKDGYVVKSESLRIERIKDVGSCGNN